MELVWTGTTGQYRPEATPLLADVRGDDALEIVVVNVGGQVLLWDAEGTPLGAGQDGMVAALGEGEWSSAPVWVAGVEPLIVFGSVGGELVALDTQFQERWRYALGAKTTWARAVPLVMQMPRETLPRLLIGDHAGVIHCLTSAGEVLWKRPLEGGECRTMLQSMEVDGTPHVLAPAGPFLHALTPEGDMKWRRELEAPILSQPVVYESGGETLIFCGAGAGALHALTLAGEPVWQVPVEDEIDSSITVLEGPEGPLVLFTGVWGNLYAVNLAGELRWMHLFRAKNRARPLIFDLDDDGQDEVLVASYDQQMRVIDHQGHLVDEVRLSGSVNASPVLLPDENEALVLTTTLLAHRLRRGAPQEVYDAAEKAIADDMLDIQWRSASTESDEAVVIRNPAGALVTVNVEFQQESGAMTIAGTVTAKSQVEFPLLPAEIFPKVRTTVSSTLPRLSSEATMIRTSGSALPSGGASIWAAPPHGFYRPEQQAPLPLALGLEGGNAVVIDPLYVNEVDQGAFIIRNNEPQARRTRIVCSPLTGEDGNLFDGRVTLREVVEVPTVNGELVADALPSLPEGNVVLLGPERAHKFWVSVDAHGAAPGEYTGTIEVAPLLFPDPPQTLTLRVVVPPLTLPEKFPLTLCTWDYIPNKWFPDQTEAVFAEMQSHGVNVYPRSTAPAAKLSETGALEMEWAKFDEELERLKGRGQFLIHIARPHIEGVDALAPAARRALEVEYLREMRDRLQSKGWSYEDYALYPVDEPGLEYGKRVPVFIEAADLFREADPQMRIYTDPVPGLSWQDYQRIEPLVDVWCPNMRLVTGLVTGDPRIRRIMDADTPVWSYECVAQVKSLSPLMYNRANAWRADYFGLDGIGFWTFSTTEANHWFGGETFNDEYALVYPGELPVPSVRWESVRDGLEDVAAMRLLEAAIEKAEAAGDRAAQVSLAREILRIARADIMELSDPAFVESRDYLREGDRRIWHTWTDALLYQQHRKAIAEATLALGR